MITYLTNQWKDRKITMFLFILGFFVASLVLSIGVSMTSRQIEYAKDQLIGEPKEQMELTLIKPKQTKVKDVVSLLQSCEKLGEIQILNCDSVSLDGKEFQVVPISFQKAYHWHIPILQGKYFDEMDIRRKQKKIVIGKQIAKECHLTIGDHVPLNGVSYEILGIAGRDYRETQWDDVIYCPLECLLPQNERLFSGEKNLSILLKGGRKEFLQKEKEFTMAAKEKGMTFYGRKLEELMDEDVQMTGVSNSFQLTIFSSVFVFVVAIINITNLMIYWILLRQEEFGIMKALGATNGYIVRSIVAEILCITLFSALLALFVQSIAAFLIHDKLDIQSIYIQPQWQNIVIVIFVAGGAGLIASVLPSIRAVKMEPVYILNGGDR